MANRVHIWGRSNSVNVQKVLWCCEELALPFDRTDAGLQFGHVDTAEYRSLNPNGRVPTLVDGEVVLWESNTIIRYLAQTRGAATLYPPDPAARGQVERWMDWTLSTLQPAERNLFWGMVRTPPEKRDWAAIHASARASADAWAVLDQQLAHGSAWIEGSDFTLADITLGAYARRWFGVEVEERPDLPRLRSWYDRLGERAGFIRYVSPALT